MAPLWRRRCRIKRFRPGPGLSGTSRYSSWSSTSFSLFCMAMRPLFWAA